jgi:hypothetical protein
MNFSNEISVILVTYNHQRYVNNCLDTLLLNEMEIIVVDNGSTDGTIELIEQEYSSIKLIKSYENLGYGRGINLGFENSTKEYIVVINPDTKVQKESILNLVKPLKNNHNTVTIPKVLFYEGKHINTCGNIEHFTGLTFTRYMGSEETQHNKAEYVGGLSGVCFALKKSDYENLGGFDKNFFMYMEDAELSWRISAYQMKILYVPDSVIYHDYILEVSPQKIYHLEVGRYLIIRKYYSKKRYLAFLPSLLLSEILTFGYAALKGKEGLKYKLKAIKDGINAPIDKFDHNSKNLLKKMDWKIPEKQLSYSLLDRTLRIIANAIFWLNLKMVTKIASWKSARNSSKTKII